MSETRSRTSESLRLAEDAERKQNWKRWGPYLSERQWGTVREDYSATGNCWEYFTHDDACRRAYRWGEDGLLGLTDRECRLCFALALWNGRDPILKERLFGLTNSQGNHGEDVKESYFYLDSTPTHSYFKGLYKYPQAEFPYARLVEENQRRTTDEPEFELVDTGIFDQNRYFDVFAEYAKAAPDDILIRLTVVNRGPERARLHLLPTLWFRNTWSWGCLHECLDTKPELSAINGTTLRAKHPTLGDFDLVIGPGPGDVAAQLLFTENETNHADLFAAANSSPCVKDAFHRFVVRGQEQAVHPHQTGTKAACHYRLDIEAGAQDVLQLRLLPAGTAPRDPLGSGFSQVFADRIREADEFYGKLHPAQMTPEERAIARQAYAGLLMSKQFYHYIVKDWLEGDPNQPAPPAGRKEGRNKEWPQIYNHDVVSLPDNWEYPWYAAWDLAFHMVAFAKLDPDFAKAQLVLFLREWYMHPNGQLPAYEFNFSDVNPPVHAWAAWRVYKITGAKGGRDRVFLERVFQKLLLNFTWWVNRKDVQGKNLFSGGFLGLDNIGLFDRSQPLPNGAFLEQSDGTAWMAFYCITMLSIGLKLAQYDPAYEDLASKFFEHFVGIADAVNCLGGSGLWDEQDGFYYDRIHTDGSLIPVRVRSMVGLIPLIAAEVLDDSVIRRLPGFSKRMDWFLHNRKDLAHHISYLEPSGRNTQTLRLLALPSRVRLERVLRYMLDEDEFLSPYGLRSVSRVHKANPYVLQLDGHEYRLGYESGNSKTKLFGGNSNWRGPVWFPLNYLIIEALERYHHFFGDSLTVECPVRSGRMLNLKEVSQELTRRLTLLFLKNSADQRPCFGADRRFADDPHWKDLLLFHEFFDGDDGRGLGASHQTGWTALVARCVEDIARLRSKVG